MTHRNSLGQLGCAAAAIALLAGCATPAVTAEKTAPPRASLRDAPAVTCLNALGSRIQRSACLPVDGQSQRMEDIQQPALVEYRMYQIPVVRVR